MSILIDKDTKVIVQGITGRDGKFHAGKMREYGTNIVGGVSPGRGGEIIEGIDIFDTASEARETTGANCSILFVPAPAVLDATYEAIEAGIELVVIVAEGVPSLEMMEIVSFAKERGVTVVGANCPGLISPGKSLVGILPANIFKRGDVGIISRSGTLTYEMVYHLSKYNIGQSSCIGVGGDPISGIYFNKLLQLFEDDPETKAVVLIGEIGGDAEERAAKYISDKITKPVVAFIAGRSAPQGKSMGHAGAIISSGDGTAESKIKAFEAAGVPVARRPMDVPNLIIKSGVL